MRNAIINFLPYSIYKNLNTKSHWKKYCVNKIKTNIKIYKKLPVFLNQVS